MTAQLTQLCLDARFECLPGSPLAAGDHAPPKTEAIHCPNALAEEVLRAARVAVRVAVAVLGNDMSAIVADEVNKLRKAFPRVSEHLWEDLHQDTLVTLFIRRSDLGQEWIDHLPRYVARTLRNRLQREARRKRREAPLGSDPEAEPEVSARAGEETPPFDSEAFAAHLARQIQPDAPLGLADLFTLLREGTATLEQIARNYRVSPDKLRQMLKAVRAHRGTFGG